MGESPVTQEDAPAHGDWAYLSLASSIPGFSVSPRVAVVTQFVAFEGAAIALAAAFDLWGALPLGTVAIMISTAGSAMMVAISDRIRELRVPAAYRRYLFDASIDIVMGLTAFIALATFLVVDAGAPGGGFLGGLLDGRLPPLAVYFALLVCWDLCYRIGIGWWASITGLWRTLRWRLEFTAATRRGYARVDALVIAFASLQLLIVPFLAAEPLLGVVVLGHVAVVLVVSGTSITLLRRG